MILPNKIKHKIDLRDGTLDQIGLSGASVYLFDDMVLKIQPNNTESDNEYRMIQWLQGKLPVPKIIEFESTNKYSFLLMSKCDGQLGCSETLMSQPKHLYELLRDALREIQSIDLSGCPSNNDLNSKLAAAEQNVILGNVDIAATETETFGANGFRDPEALLHWLKENRPAEELVLSHGDFCLPNVLFKDGKLTGLIDLGKTGIGDKWCDIALYYRSTKNNYNGRYLGTAARNYLFNESEFFDIIEQKPDWDKLRYYILLDELF